MSHFTTIQTKLTDLATLKRALTDLGYQYAEGGAKIQGYSGTETVDLAVKVPGGYDIGFRRQGGAYEVVGDWWGIRVERAKFLAEITQRYAYQTVVTEATQLGFTITTEERQRDGSIRLVMQRWR